MNFRASTIRHSKKLIIGFHAFLLFYLVAIGGETLHLLTASHSSCPEHPGEVLEASDTHKEISHSLGINVSNRDDGATHASHEHCFVTQLWRNRKKERILTVVSAELARPLIISEASPVTFNYNVSAKSILFVAPKNSPPNPFV